MRCAKGAPLLFSLLHRAWATCSFFFNTCTDIILIKTLICAWRKNIIRQAHQETLNSLKFRPQPRARTISHLHQCTLLAMWHAGGTCTEERAQFSNSNHSWTIIYQTQKEDYSCGVCSVVFCSRHLAYFDADRDPWECYEPVHQQCSCLLGKASCNEVQMTKSLLFAHCFVIINLGFISC